MIPVCGRLNPARDTAAQGFTLDLAPQMRH
jgi:hypothetical protein